MHASSWTEASAPRRGTMAAHRRIAPAEEDPMKREVVRVEPLSTWLERWKAPTSVVTRHGDTIYVSGLPPFDPATGEVADVPIERQAELVLEQLKLCVETAGSTMSNVLKCNVYLRDINDFKDEGKLAAYFGIVPRVSNSNETERLGRITKRGSKLGRTALVQCALIAQRYSPYLKRYYEKIKARRGTGKAIIALARKLLGVIYRTLKNNWVFEDFPNFVLAEAV